jgi:hypothetical protein
MRTLMSPHSNDPISMGLKFVVPPTEVYFRLLAKGLQVK